MEVEAHTGKVSDIRQKNKSIINKAAANGQNGAISAQLDTEFECLICTHRAIVPAAISWLFPACQRPAATQVGPYCSCRMGRALPADQKSLRNRILAGLSAADFARLCPDLEAVELPVRKQLESRNRRIEHLWFLESGLASVVTSGGSQHSVEVGVIGYESMTGFAVLLGAGRTPCETFIQSEGSAWRIDVAHLTQAIEGSRTLRESLLLHFHLFHLQTSFTALANARYKLEERLARWLLMAQDRVGCDIHLTHEYLSLMLGVRRPGVTIALNLFEEHGIIRASRGVITILDRRELEDLANGSYGAPEAEYERLFGRRM